MTCAPFFKDEGSWISECRSSCIIALRRQKISQISIVFKKKLTSCIADTFQESEVFSPEKVMAHSIPQEAEELNCLRGWWRKFQLLASLRRQLSPFVEPSCSWSILWCVTFRIHLRYQSFIEPLQQTRTLIWWHWFEGIGENRELNSKNFAAPKHLHRSWFQDTDASSETWRHVGSFAHSSRSRGQCHLEKTEVVVTISKASSKTFDLLLFHPFPQPPAKCTEDALHPCPLHCRALVGASSWCSLCLAYPTLQCQNPARTLLFLLLLLLLDHRCWNSWRVPSSIAHSECLQQFPHTQALLPGVHHHQQTHPGRSHWPPLHQRLLLRKPACRDSPRMLQSLHKPVKPIAGLRPKLACSMSETWCHVVWNMWFWLFPRNVSCFCLFASLLRKCCSVIFSGLCWRRTNKLLQIGAHELTSYKMQMGTLKNDPSSWIGVKAAVPVEGAFWLFRTLLTNKLCLALAWM